VIQEKKRGWEHMFFYARVNVTEQICRQKD
jgi:hypothetical protein